MARHVHDLHPDDHAARVRIHRQLRQLRRDTGMRRRDVADRMGMDPANLGRLERNGADQSRAVTIAAWARALDHRLVLTLDGYPPPCPWRRQEQTPRMNVIAALLETRNVAAFGGEDAYRIAALTVDLIGVRNACGVSQRALAAQLNVSEACVSQFENGITESLLALLQRYARGITYAGRYRSRRCTPSAHLAVAVVPADEQVDTEPILHGAVSGE